MGWFLRPPLNTAARMPAHSVSGSLKFLSKHDPPPLASPGSIPPGCPFRDRILARWTLPDVTTITTQLRHSVTACPAIEPAVLPFPAAKMIRRLAWLRQPECGHCLAAGGHANQSGL